MVINSLTLRVNALNFVPEDLGMLYQFCFFFFITVIATQI